MTLYEALGHAEAAGVGGASLKAVDKLRTLLQSLQAQSQELPVAELVQRVLEQSGYLESLEAERTIEARGRIENLQELVGVAQEYAEQAEEPSLSEFLQQISLFSDQDTIRGGAEPRHADDPPQRQGPRVRRRVHDRDGGGHLPALPARSRSRGSRRSGGSRTSA